MQRDLRNPVALHRRAMSLVPDGLGESPRAQAGVLFRLDTDGTGAPVLLVQSRVAPDQTRLPQGYAEVHAREMQALFGALRPGLVVRYRLLGNTVRRCGPNSTAGRWKQAIALHGEDADRWWTERATAAGLALRTILSDSADTLSTWHVDARDPSAVRSKEEEGGEVPSAAAAGVVGGRRSREGQVLVPRQATRFEGTAVVRDAQSLRNALLNGIGRSKSYGCGLLSLAPGGQEG
ncbi:type I-E CRISPR-associated protein Cas6/Cse3/CasE [Streptomyces sp. NBC_01506]|uniref:type I-E CRISPR-associated protein Cas6/Cse3/CasE n=1 Tax=Streptomyces sp. NBC_01506 TaxID=2903887 RepID=UPI00386352B1